MATRIETVTTCDMCGAKEVAEGRTTRAPKGWTSVKPVKKPQVHLCPKCVSKLTEL